MQKTLTVVPLLGGCPAQDYKETQKVAVQKEASSLPRQPTPTPSSSAAAAAQEASTSGRSDADIESQALLQQQQQVEARALDNAITFNEALIEERDHSIAGRVKQDPTGWFHRPCFWQTWRHWLSLHRLCACAWCIHDVMQCIPARPSQPVTDARGVPGCLLQCHGIHMDPHIIAYTEPVTPGCCILYPPVQRSSSR